jgi:hypothetical protein
MERIEHNAARHRHAQHGANQAWPVIRRFCSAVQSVHPAADRRWCFLMGHRFFRLNYFRLLISWFQ